MWLVIINPISKLALTLAPVAMAVEVRGAPAGECADAGWPMHGL